CLEFAVVPGRAVSRELVIASSRVQRRLFHIGTRGRQNLSARTRGAAAFSDQSILVTLTFVPPRTLASVFTSPSALAKMLQGLASRASSPWLIGVRPEPSAMAWPSGQ